MLQYRCYFLDAQNHVVEVEAAEHPSDRHAIDWADSLSRTHRTCAAVELWSRMRMVHRQTCRRSGG